MLKGSTVKEVNVYCRQNNFTVIAWSMFSQRKTECHPMVIPFHGNLLSGMLRKTLRIDELQCCFDVEVLVCRAVKKCSSVGGRKKIGVDWPRPSRFRKKFSKSQCSNRKIGVDRSRKNKKASSAASVFNFLQNRSPGGRRSVLHFDGLPLTRGAVVATPFAAAVSLTFSLVKNLKMLLQAKRQPG